MKETPCDSRENLLKDDGHKIVWENECQFQYWLWVCFRTKYVFLKNYWISFHWVYKISGCYSFLWLFLHIYLFFFVVSLDNGRQRWDEKGTTGSRNQVDQTERSEIVLSDEWTILRRWWIYWKEKQSIPEPKSSVWEEWEIELMREDEEKRGLRAIFCNHRVFYEIQSLEKEGKLNDFQRWTSPTVTVFLTHE